MREARMTDVDVTTPPIGRRLDAIDRRILTLIQENSSLSVADIGDIVGLSATPCWKRIKRLEGDGVIAARLPWSIHPRSVWI
jgi:Lrp/AsnC family transcriptional regulator